MDKKTTAIAGSGNRSNLKNYLEFSFAGQVFMPNAA